MHSNSTFLSLRGSIHRAVFRRQLSARPPGSPFSAVVILRASTKMPEGPQLTPHVPKLPKTTITPFKSSSLRILCALCVSVAIPFLSSAQQTQLNIAAASDLKFALTDLASTYEKQSGAKLNLTFGSSGNFFAQIQNGAPFDIFFSADSD